MIPTIIMLAAAGTKIPGSLFGMPEQASTIADDVDWIFNFVIWVSLFFFVLIVVLMLVFMFKYRRRAHVASTGGPTHNTPLEVIWTAIPMVLAAAMFYFGFKGYMRIATPPENAYQIQVTGRQWSWQFDYPNGAKIFDGTLQVPVDRPVTLTMRSDDVIHAMFIPAFRVKQDVVPGKRTQLWFQATRVGEFDLFCAEYCGTNHSKMVGRVIAYDEEEFEQVIADAARWIDRVADDKLHLAGVRLFNQCTNCHSIDGSTLIGPSFKETHDLFVSGGERQLADGTSVVVDEAYLLDSILRPVQRIAVNAATGKPYPSSMPVGIGNQLGERRRLALARMIMQLDEVVTPEGTLREVTEAELDLVENPDAD
ncbi:MAG: cytochrome c oxidase subunit II [Acidimicrobiia bacterium]